MRPLRVLFFTNNGLGAGHLARTLAIAKALRRKTDRLELMLATTSEADALLAAVPIATVRWPAPLAARESGWSDQARRDVARRVVRGAIEGFRPDLLVTDTFPHGPHGELSGLVREVPHRVLVRRSVRAERAGEGAAYAGLSEYDLAIVPDDPVEHASPAQALPIPTTRVPPITLFEAHEAHDRETARARLGLPREGRFILVCSGGGGDPEAVRAATHAAEIVLGVRGPEAATPVLAEGPLERRIRGAHGEKTIARAHETPLQPFLAAFDGAIAPAGYNLAHELAKAGVPTALFAMPRPFDDQAARAARFEQAGIGRALATIDEETVAASLAWMARAPKPSLLAGGADSAAQALLELMNGAAP